MSGRSMVPAGPPMPDTPSPDASGSPNCLIAAHRSPKRCPSLSGSPNFSCSTPMVRGSSSLLVEGRTSADRGVPPEHLPGLSSSRETGNRTVEINRFHPAFPGPPPGCPRNAFLTSVNHGVSSISGVERGGRAPRQPRKPLKTQEKTPAKIFSNHLLTDI
jgi:hypothetical protein